MCQALLASYSSKWITLSFSSRSISDFFKIFKAQVSLFFSPNIPFLSKIWITLSSVNCFNTGNAIEKMNESATSTKRPRILLPPFYIDCYRLLLFRHFYKIFSTIFYLHNTLAHIVYQTFFVQMTIRVSIPHKA